jgi:hypothetical protein
MLLLEEKQLSFYIVSAISFRMGQKPDGVLFLHNVRVIYTVRAYWVRRMYKLFARGVYKMCAFCAQRFFCGKLISGAGSTKSCGGGVLTRMRHASESETSLSLRVVVRSSH